MREILQSSVPEGAEERAASLPGVGPVPLARWLLRDDAFAGQMGERARLLETRREDVAALCPEGRAAAEELLSYVTGWLATYGAGYDVSTTHVTRPDGVEVEITRDDPLECLGHLVQEDFCLLERQGDEHVLVGAVLCFPASWSLDQKIGRPLNAIHRPVPEYDAGLARRVQRLFDGVQVDRPLRRYNYLTYERPELFQPRREDDPRDHGTGAGYPYARSERQCVLRLPSTRACVFSIHTYVARLS